MAEKITILSTKKLTLSQQELLLNAGIGWVAYNAISVEFVEHTIDNHEEHLIFTSKNAVKAVLGKEHTPYANTKEKVIIFCVGNKTKTLIESFGYRVQEVAVNAKALAEIIVHKYSNESFVFYCGNRRREELPLLLQKNEVIYKEQVVYTTTDNTMKIARKYAGILFFSPSAVQSYCTQNALEDSMVFCIGSTTAGEVKKYTNTYTIANKPTVENVIVQVVKYYKR